VRDVFFGVRRFDDFVNDLGISRGVLTDRLVTLVDHGILVKHRYHEAPDRFEYRLTDKGRDLFPVLRTLMQWGDKWLSTPEVGGAPVVIEHDDCGRDIAGSLLCGHCHEPAYANAVTAQVGPGSAPGAQTPTITPRGDNQ